MTFATSLRKIAAPLVLLSLAACASSGKLGLLESETLPTTVTEVATVEHKPHSISPEVQAQFDASGRISVQYQQDEQDKNLSGSFEWQQNNTELNIRLLSPLGQTIAEIRQNESGAQLIRAKEETRYAANIEALMSENLAWSLPVQRLSWWMQGFDLDENQQAHALPRTEKLELRWQEWRVRIIAWQMRGKTSIPKRLDLERVTTDMGLLKIRIVLNAE